MRFINEDRTMIAGAPEMRAHFVEGECVVKTMAVTISIVDGGKKGESHATIQEEAIYGKTCCNQRDGGC